MTDSNLQEKMDKLNIKPVTDEIYLSHQRDYQHIGIDVSPHKYYKQYGDVFMFYTEEYLVDNTLSDLMETDKHNKKMFKRSLLSRLDDWLFSIRLRYFR